jgi:hypothetical protein
MQQHQLNRWLSVGLGIGIVVCLAVITFRQATPTESLLISLFLTVLSMLASWFASRYYSELSFAESLRLFALKASEKVDNLSNELTRLSLFLQDQDNMVQEEQTPEHQILAWEIKNDAAIHIINTLKSINDRSLSDWQGVIGDELNAQRQQRVEQEEEISALIERVESLYSTQSATMRQEGSDARTLRLEIESIKGDLRRLTTQMTGVPFQRHRSPLPPLLPIRCPCPECSAVLQYQQRPRIGKTKTIKCDNCHKRFISRFDGTKFALHARQSLVETIECPQCHEKMALEVDELPGGLTTETTCSGCAIRLRVCRGTAGLKVTQVSSRDSNQSFDEHTFEYVKNALPAQPWPKGIHECVANELNLPSSIVSKIITELIRRGVFQPQVDGRVCPIRGGVESNGVDDEILPAKQNAERQQEKRGRPHIA